MYVRDVCMRVSINAHMCGCVCDRVGLRTHAHGTCSCLVRSRARRCTKERNHAERLTSVVCEHSEHKHRCASQRHVDARRGDVGHWHKHVLRKQAGTERADTNVSDSPQGSLGKKARHTKKGQGKRTKACWRY